MLHIYLAMVETPEDRDKVEAIYNEYRGLMLKRAYDILKNFDAAQDAVHDAFVNIIENLDKVGKVSCHKTKSFVVIVTENVCTNIYRRNKKRKIIPIEDVENQLPDPVDLEEKLADQIRLEQVARALESLPETYRSVMTLKVIQEYSDKEIAKELGITHEAARKRIERARRLLAKNICDEV